MKVPLLEYLDKLEATAKLVTLGSLVDENTQAQLQQYFLATQPEATLTLIAKLREAVEHMRVAAKLAIRHRPADIINDFQDGVVAWAQIEVPE